MSRTLPQQQKGISMDRDSIDKIDASRERLQQFMEETSSEDLARPIDGDWTAAALLAHTAFWDRRAAWLVRRCLQGTCTPSPVDLDAVNEAVPGHSGGCFHPGRPRKKRWMPRQRSTACSGV
jgi:hypothetical protein